MVTEALRRHAKLTLAHTPWVWGTLRQYVRYSPRALILPALNQRVHDFYAHSTHSFVTRTTGGRHFRGETRDIIQRYLFLYGCWEPNLSRWLSARLRADDVLIDVGANIGYFSLLAATRVGPNGRVVAIEASPSIYERLSENIQLNGDRNIRAVHAAAADTRGRLRLFRAPAFNLGASSIYADVGYEDEGEVDAYPLHQLLTTDEIRRARIVKVDVEGAETGVIDGLVPMLPSCRDDVEIIVEVGGGPAGSPSANQSAAAIMAALSGQRFHAYKIVNDYRPAAYVRARRYSAPTRVRSANEITEECDLIFSRRDAASL